MRSYIANIVRFRWLVLLGALVITAMLVSRIGHLQVVADPNKMLPSSHPYILTSNRVQDLFGSRYVLVISITPAKGTIYDPAVLAKVKRITDKLREVPDVVKSNVLSFAARKAKSITGTADGMIVRPLMTTVPGNDAEMQALERGVADNPAYKDLLVSHDNRSVAILAEIKDDPKGFDAVMQGVNPIVDAERDPSVQIRVAGLPVVVTALENYAARLAILLPLALLLIAVVLWFAFRSFQGLILPLVTALLAVLWSLGLMSLFKVQLDPINAATPVMILAVAAGHAVQILKRYYEEYKVRALVSPDDLKAASRSAVVESLTKIGPVMIVAGVVAAAGFLSLLVVAIGSVRTFAIMAAGGVLSSLLLELTLIPALRSMLPAPKPRLARTGDGPLDRLMTRLGELVTGPKAKWIVAGAAGVVALSVWGGSMVEYDDNYHTWFSASNPLLQDDYALNKSYAGTNTLYVLVESKTPGRMQDPDVLKAIDDTQTYLERNPMVGKTLSLATFVRRMNMAMHGDDPKFGVIPDDRALTAQYLFLYSSSGDPGDFDNYVDNDFSHANIYGFLRDFDTTKTEQLIEDLKAYTAKRFPSDITVSFGGSVAQGAAFHEIVSRAKLLNMAQIAVVFFLLASLVFRSPMAGVLVLLPLGLTVAVTFAVMGFFGIPFSSNNCVTVAMGVSVGADYVIYLLFRLREENRRAGTDSDAMKRTLSTAGEAILFVAGSVAIGYSVLMLSFGFWVHIWMGLLISIAMITSAVAAITLVPVVVGWVRPGFIYGGRPSLLGAAVPLFAGAILLGAMAGPQDARADVSPSADDIMQKNYMVDRVTGSTATITLTLRNPKGEERIREAAVTSKLEGNGVDNQSLSRFIAPADVKGTSVLLIEHSDADDDMWLFLPALGKSRRLIASNKRDSFMGSDFSYGDVIGYPVKDWHNKLVGEATVSGEQCYQVESTPASDEVRDTSGYSKRLTCVSKTRFVTLHADIWDTDGEKLKEEDRTEFVNVDPARGKWVATRLSARNLETGHSTEVVIHDYRLSTGIPQSTFTVRALESGQ